MRAWLILEKSEDKLVSKGIDSYQDKTGQIYHYDSLVPNYKQIETGAKIIIRRDTEIIGVGLLGDIKCVKNQEKSHRRCPKCNKTSIRKRKKKKPPFICPLCKHTFFHPVETVSVVDDYYADIINFAYFISPPSVEDIKNCALKGEGKKSQLSILELDKAKLEKLLLNYSVGFLDPIVTKTKLLRSLIITGPPGAGKSHQLSQRLIELNLKDETTHQEKRAQVTRVTCHAEMTSADFIGAYQPNTDDQGKLHYRFEPGPFTRLLHRALRHLDEQHVLIIEELNRANAAAMFAEAFQLLDRVEDETRQDQHWSTYPTSLGTQVWDYLTKRNQENIDEEALTDTALDHLNGAVRLPPNFAIWATLNTADQSVFPLDTAFKRRWSFEHLGVDEGFETWRHDPWNPDLPTAGVPWQTFRVALNHALEQLEVEEDRLIGPFFLTERELQEPETNVVDKVLSYLRDDVLRYEPKGLFVGVNDKGEPSSEGRAPSFAWLKRQHDQTGLLSLFKGKLSASLEFAKSWIKAREDELNAQAPKSPMHEVLSGMSGAQTPQNTSEEPSATGGP